MEVFSEDMVTNEKQQVAPVPPKIPISSFLVQFSPSSPTETFKVGAALFKEIFEEEDETPESLQKVRKEDEDQRLPKSLPYDQLWNLSTTKSKDRRVAWNELSDVFAEEVVPTSSTFVISYPALTHATLI